MLDLTDAGRRHQPDATSLPALSDADRAIAVRTWRGRMCNEYVSAGVWSVLVRQLMEAGAPAELVMDAGTAVTDELRHAAQCAGCVLALGGEAIAESPALEPVPEHEDAGRLEAVVRNLLSVGCLSETIAVSLIRAEHVELAEGPLAETLSTILADEIRHARFGWKALGQLLPMLDADATARLNAYLVDALAHQVAYEVPKLGTVRLPHYDLAQTGVCDAGFSRSLFVDTIETVLVPGLDRAGLDGTAAWNVARQRTSHLLAS